MINGHNITKINDEEILYIYLDFNYEFAKDGSKEEDIRKKIKKYIKNNNIKFKGSVVALMVGGIFIGTMTLNKPKMNSVFNSNSNNNIVAIIDNNTILENEDNNIIEEDTSSILDNNIKEKSEVKYSVSNESNTKLEEKLKLPETKKEIDYIPSEEKIDTNYYVTIYRKDGSILKLDLEEYIIGVVASEMPASFNIEALKAQSVISRTYAMKSTSSNKKLTDDNNTQNYKSKEELQGMWGNDYDKYYNKIKSAVDSTKGMYLTYNGETIDAVYHSTSNGYTEDARNVWGNSKPYLKSVSSPYDSTNKNFSFTLFISYEDISKKINSIVDINTDFNIISRNESGRVDTIEVNGVKYSGVNFRTILGLRSTDFDIEKDVDGVNIVTRGYGHGVGMSQYGANGMANNGSNYEEILFHYYTGVSFKSL